MRRSTTLLMSLMSAISLTFVLSACTSASDDTSATTDATEAGTDSTDPKGDGSKGGTKGGTAADPTDLGASEGAQCLLGTWLVDPQSVADITIASAGLTGDVTAMDPQVTITGDGLITYSAEGIATTEYRHQVVDLTLSTDGATVHASGWTEGTMTSSYTATDTEITTFDGDASGIEMEMTTTVNGEPFDTGDTSAMTIASWELGSTATYVCSGDTLELTPVATGFDTSDFTMHYTRQ